MLSGPRGGAVVDRRDESSLPAESEDAARALLAEGMRRGVMSLLGIELVEARPDRVTLRVEVDERLHQPYGILHGGVSALLAETAASLGGALAVQAGETVAGIELNASHLRPMQAGELLAVATPLRLGRSVHVWDVTLHDGLDRLICKARCTLAVLRNGPTGSTRSSTNLGGK